MPRFRVSCLALVAAFCGLAAVAARADDVPPLRSMQPPFFGADVSTTLDSLGSPSVSVTFTVPCTELNWSKLPGGYAAGVGVMLELQPSRGDRLYGGTWEKRVLVAQYAATRSARNNLVLSRSFEVPPGKYRVRARVRDLGSEQESVAEDQLTIEDLSHVPVGFSDIQLGVVDSAGAFALLPNRTFGYEVDRLAARVTALDKRPGEWPRQAAIHWRILDDQQNPQAQGDTTLTLRAPVQSLVLRPAAGELFIGTYSLALERVEGRSRWRASRSFEVEESGPPHGRAYQEILDALAYIAPSNEVDAMRAVNPDQQALAWDRFWRRRDPTPDTPRNEYMIEFFRRLRYAEQHFQGFGAGWRSDMGRIYVKFGAPDQVEQHAATTAMAQTEVWFYNQPYRRFVFVDREGFGRFTLQLPSSE